MTFARHTIALLAGSLVLGTGAHAQEIQIKGSFSTEYNSNFQGSQGSKDPAFTNRFGPSIRLSDPHGRLTSQITYRGRYQWLLDEDGLNDWENALVGEISYAIGLKGCSTRQTAAGFP